MSEDEKVIRLHDPRKKPPHPIANSFTVWFCGKPSCGLHLVSFDAKGAVICETTMSPNQTIGMVATCIEELNSRLENGDLP